MSSDVVIRVEGLTKSFRLYERPEHRLMELVSFGRVQRHRTFTALKDVSLEIRRGETVGIVGRNGCGKSTLLQVICGILQPTMGTVTTHGRIAALLELGAGFDGNFTGRENVYLNGALHGRTRAEMDERIAAIIAFADIGEFIDRPVKTYSSGMFVRLAFGTAVNVDPDILVVDEALAVGDEAFQRKCFARIEQIREQGATILFVSHAAQTIVQLCDRAVLMDGGEKLMEGTPKAVVGQYQRLVNASGSSAEQVRESIATMRQTSDDDVNTPSDPQPAHAYADEEQGHPIAQILTPIDKNETGSRVRVDPQRPNMREYFDTGLISVSQIEYDRIGAHIHNFQLTTLSGELVNVILSGRRYRLSFDVDFTVEASNIGFAFGIRTVSGLLLGGAASFLVPSRRIAKVTPNSSFHVDFEFDCQFLPGTYFTLFGVRGIVNGEEVVLHRIIDALCMRVASEGETMLTGLIDLNVQLEAR